MSFGTERVGANFNPSGLGVVDQIKTKTAELIDLLNDLNYDADSEDMMYEKDRLVDIAMERYEEACMWAVKAVTKK